MESINFIQKSWTYLNNCLNPETYQSPRSHKKTFSQNITKGLTSDTFNIFESNYKLKDERPGLNSDEVESIMNECNCTFDEARWILFCRRCYEHNVDPITGLPMDPKAIYSL